MYRFIIPALFTLSFSSVAIAHPTPKPDVEKSVESSPFERPQLPTKAEIQDAIKQMPDMNAIMGDMLTLMKDESFREDMEQSARAFGDRIEESGALEKDANGLPDFNKAFAVMLETFSDEDAMGGMLDTMMGLAETMEQHIPVEKHTPEASKEKKTLEDALNKKAPE